MRKGLLRAGVSCILCEGMPRDTRQPFLGTQVGEPVSGEIHATATTSPSREGDRSNDEHRSSHLTALVRRRCVGSALAYSEYSWRVRDSPRQTTPPLADFGCGSADFICHRVPVVRDSPHACTPPRSSPVDSDASMAGYWRDVPCPHVVRLLAGYICVARRDRRCHRGCVCSVCGSRGIAPNSELAHACCPAQRPVS